MKIEINKIKYFFKKHPRVLAENAFGFSIIFIFLSLILGGLIFYKYGILNQKTKIDVAEETFRFQEGAYQEILKIWQEREGKFNAINSKQYSNPFQGPSPTPVPTPKPTPTK